MGLESFDYQSGGTPPAAAGTPAAAALTAPTGAPAPAVPAAPTGTAAASTLANPSVNIPDCLSEKKCMSSAEEYEKCLKRLEMMTMKVVEYISKP